MGGLGQQLKGVILYVSLCARQRFFKESAIRFLKNAKKGGRTAEKGIQDQFSDFLVGSGAKNMVTQNENESIDFDYNLNIISCPDWEEPRSIKESVRKAMNRIMTNEGLGTVDDSTSCLTTKTISFKDSPENKWSIDLCIVTKDSDGNWQRLIHEKRDSLNMIGIFGILPQIQKTIHIKQRKSRNVLDGGTKSETAI